MKSSVYEVVDVQSGEVVYVGKTDDLKKRWNTNLTAATSPLIRAMVLNGVDRYEPRVIADFPTGDEALDHERALVREKQPPFNRNLLGLDRPHPQRRARRTSSKVWNGRLSRDQTYNTWFGKWRESVGVWRMKRVPPSIQGYDQALTWFANWLNEQGLIPSS